MSHVTCHMSHKKYRQPWTSTRQMELLQRDYQSDSAFHMQKRKKLKEELNFSPWEPLYNLPTSSVMCILARWFLTLYFLPYFFANLHCVFLLRWLDLFNSSVFRPKEKQKKKKRDNVMIVNWAANSRGHSLTHKQSKKKNWILIPP